MPTISDASTPSRRAMINASNIRSFSSLRGRLSRRKKDSRRSDSTRAKRPLVTSFSVMRTKLVVNQVWVIQQCLAEDDDGLRQGSGDAAADGEQVRGCGEDLDQGSLGEVGKVDLHPVA